MSEGVIVFDMDGVLVDVSESYREAIRQTVAHFTNTLISKELIQDYKNAGGWNNDWALSQKIIQDLGCNAEYHVVVDYFQSIFFGDEVDALMLRERWIPQDGLLERLHERFAFGIFTGRLRSETEISLHRFVPGLQFDAIVADDDVPNPKPAPDGLLIIAKRYPGKRIWYIGDTVDDARSARAAGITFIGVAERTNPRHNELVDLFRQEKASAIVESINEVETVL